MRFKGTLIEWKDDRGFGFIQQAEGGDRVFCHIKAFDVRVRRPVAGDRVTYEVGKDAQGRLTAMKVRPVGLEEAQYQSNIRLHREPKARQSLSAMNMGILICLIVVIGYAGFSYLKSNQSGLMTTVDEQVAPTALKSESRTDEKEQPPAFKSESGTVIKESSTAFHCDGRVYCSQMNSRAEAEFFIKHCPGTKMDGDHDGVPCENDSRF